MLDKELTQGTSQGKAKLGLHLKNIYLFSTYLAVPGLSRSKWNLVTQPGMEPKPPALEEWNPSQQKIREVFLSFFFFKL